MGCLAPLFLLLIVLWAQIVVPWVQKNNELPHGAEPVISIVPLEVQNQRNHSKMGR